MLYALFCPGGIRYDPAGKKRDALGLYRAGAAGSVMAVGQNGQLADLYVPVSTEGMRLIIKTVYKSPADAAVCGYIAIAVRIIFAYEYVSCVRQSAKQTSSSVPHVSVPAALSISFCVGKRSLLRSFWAGEKPSNNVWFDNLFLFYFLFI